MSKQKTKGGKMENTKKQNLFIFEWTASDIVDEKSLAGWLVDEEPRIARTNGSVLEVYEVE